MAKKKHSSRKKSPAAKPMPTEAPALSVKCLYIGRVLGRVSTSMEQVLEASRRGDKKATRDAVDHTIVRVQAMVESFPMTHSELAPVIADLERVKKTFPKTKSVGDLVMGHARRLGALQAQANRTCGAK